MGGGGVCMKLEDPTELVCVDDDAWLWRARARSLDVLSTGEERSRVVLSFTGGTTAADDEGTP